MHRSLCYAPRGMRALRRDPLFVVAAVTVACLAVIEFVLPLPADLVDTISWYGDFFLVGLLLFGAFRAFRAEPSAGGRRFWRLVTVSFGFWLSVLLVWEVTASSSGTAEVDVLTDFLFLCYYFGLILATAVRPHVRREQPVLSPLVVTEMAAGGILAFGLLAYFVVLPSRLTPHAYETFTPSLSLYVLLDVVLLLRLGWWCMATVGSRWRPVYVAITVGLAFTLLHDVHELLVYQVGQQLETGPWEIAWWGQFFGLLAGERLSRLSARSQPPAPPRETAGPDLGYQAILGPVASYAFVLPVVHLGGKVAGMLDPALDSARETLVLVCTLALGGLAIVHYELMDRRYRLTRETLHDAQILLQQSRKMESLGRLAGGIAHGFNNLLSVIIGYAELLADRLPPGDGMQDPVQQIRQAAERAASVTRQLAIFSRGQLGHDTPFEVDKAVEDLRPTLRHLLGPRISLAVVPGARGRWVESDVHQFERALLNIAANAKDAMPDGGAFSLETGDLIVREGQSRVYGLLPAGPYIQITLSDTGPGMDEDVRSQVFEPFYTTRHEDGHRGLGLSFVYGVVRQAGGHIDVRSTPGCGTSVVIYLPRRQPPARPPKPEAPPRLVDRPVTILLAEDERGLRRLMKSSLESEGFTVLEASDGRTAVDIAEQHVGRIDLLLSDVVMPGYTGPEVAARVVAERPETSVMFVSGYAPETLGDLRVGGADVVLMPKPFTMEELSDRVRTILAGQPTASV